MPTPIEIMNDDRLRRVKADTVAKARAKVSWEANAIGHQAPEELLMEPVLKEGQKPLTPKARPTSPGLDAALQDLKAAYELPG